MKLFSLLLICIAAISPNFAAAVVFEEAVTHSESTDACCSTTAKKVVPRHECCGMENHASCDTCIKCISPMLVLAFPDVSSFCKLIGSSAEFLDSDQYLSSRIELPEAPPPKAC